jgi:ELWxxDGT repeat protein
MKSLIHIATMLVTLVGRSLCFGQASLVFDLCPGPCDALITFQFVNGNRFFFAGNNNVSGQELWSCDGINMSGYDIWPGPMGSTPGFFCSLNGALFFGAADGLNGIEPWQLTLAGPQLVSNINPGPTSSTPMYLCSLGSYVYFSADDGINGQEIWKTNRISTSMVQDIFPEAQGSYPANLISNGTMLYFLADNGTNGSEFWKYDVSVSIDESMEEMKPAIYPNPATTLVHFDFKTRVKHAIISIADIRGAVVGCAEVSDCSEYTLNNSLPPGMYFVRLSISPENATLLKLIITE